MNALISSQQLPPSSLRRLAPKLALSMLLPLLSLQTQAFEQSDEPLENPAYSKTGAYLASLGDNLLLLGDSITSLDGATSGFRLTAGFTPYDFPLLDIGAEIDYRESDEVPLTASQGYHHLVDTTSLGGSLLAGLRIGNFGLYAKSGVAGWKGESVTGQPGTSLDGGMTRVNGFGAHLVINGVISRLQYERFDEPSLEHLNLVTASVHLPF